MDPAAVCTLTLCSEQEQELNILNATKHPEHSCLQSYNAEKSAFCENESASMGTWQIWLNCSCFTIRLNSTGLIMINAGNGRGKKKKKLLLTHWCGCESPCSGGEHVVINSNTIISIIIIIIIFFFTLFFLLVTCLRLLPVVITVLLMALALHKPPLQHSRYFLSLDLIHSCILFSHSLVPPVL